MVQYSPKLTFGPEAADWQERFNPDRMRRLRVERAQRLMRKHGIATLLEANHQNIRYLTALKGFAYPMCRYALFFAEHDAVMYEHDGYYHQMPDQCPWIKEWRPARSWLTGAPGVGGFLWQEYNSLIYAHILLAIITIGVIGFALDRLMGIAEAKLRTA